MSRGRGPFAVVARRSRSPSPGRARPACVLLAVLCLFATPPADAFEAQGHRGARGLWPENTLPAFAGALAIGVDVLELDLALTADDVVVVSHDPVLDTDITRDEDGSWLQPPTPAIRSLTFEQLGRYDVGRSRPGSRHALRFPRVQPVDGTRIPRLDEVFDLARRAGAGTVRFNIETKVEPGGGALYPDPAHFARRVVHTVREAGMSERVT
ncbi:MAG: glycerophosphodiester phosphodiesterase, partial [Bauldia sp.]|nr:glycerophosphodiester phosphodiesterase [Bauldia sp.]